MGNARREIVDSSMTLEGYELTDYAFNVHSILAYTTVPAVVNYVTMTMAFRKKLEAGTIGHITINAPLTTKVLCQRVVDISGGGSSLVLLPLRKDFGTHGTHSCQHQNTVTLHVDESEPLGVGSHIFRIGVLNPATRAEKDYWIVELLGGSLESPHENGSESNWHTAQSLVQVRMSGFGISSAFSGPSIRAVDVSTT